MTNNKTDASSKKSPPTRKQLAMRLAGLALILIILAFATIKLGEPLIRFISNPDVFRPWIENLGWFGPAVMVAITILQVVVAFIPGEAVEIAAGFTFGAIPGMLLCLLGSVIATCIIFPITKKFGRRITQLFVTEEQLDSLKFIHDTKRRNLLVFILFLIPGTPKDMITYFIGLTPMKLGQFLILSTIGRIPAVIASTIGGSAISVRNYGFAIAVFAVTAIISLIGLFVYQHLSNKERKLL